MLFSGIDSIVWHITIFNYLGFIILLHYQNNLN